MAIDYLIYIFEQIIL